MSAPALSISDCAGRSSKQREARAALMQRRRHRRAIKTMLILCNEKLLVPLMFILLDSSSVLLALWLDSVMVFSVWVALTPLLLLYLALSKLRAKLAQLIARLTERYPKHCRGSASSCYSQGVLSHPFFVGWYSRSRRRCSALRSTYVVTLTWAYAAASLHSCASRCSRA